LEGIMQPASGTRTLEFVPSRQRAAVNLQRLRERLVEFLELYADVPVVDPRFVDVIGNGDGVMRFDRLLEAAGHSGNADAFLNEVLDRLSSASSSNPPGLAIGSVQLPRAVALEILEHLMPGDELYDVKRLARLEKLSNLEVPEPERAAIQRVLDQYPVRLSSHVVRQMRLSTAVAYQYLPFVDELDPDGLVHTWVGQFHRGVIEQMYRNRVIFVLNMSCPVYCRFCFRKHKECRTQRPPTQRHVSLGIRYIRESPGIKEIVVTGGDPFMNRPTLTWAVDGLASIAHVETLRLATRSLAYHPALFTARDGWWLHWLERKQVELVQKGKRIEVATHFIHPDEVSRHSLEVISELTSRGVGVYVQTPFLGGCNDRGPELEELYRLLRGAGAEMHYIFMPCSPLQGNRRYLSTLADGFYAFAHLRGHLSDRAVPHLCTATAIGKIDWGGSGWVVEPDADEPGYLWLRTPYTTDYFEAFAPILDLSRVARSNSEGTLDARFRVEVGDGAWVLGPREDQGWSRDVLPPASFPSDQASRELEERRRAALEHQGPGGPVVSDSRVEGLFRVHRARVELDLAAGEEVISSALGWIAADERITDVVVFSRRDAARSLHVLGALHERLLAIPHVTALRVRSRAVVSEPRTISDGVISRIGSLNRIRLTRPLRIEVELTVLHPSDLTDDVGRLVRGLRRRGVSVYANIPLLMHLNDDATDLLDLTSRCRRMGVEVHHLLLAGHPLQEGWADAHPVPVGRVVDLATALRREGSGRELPRLIVQTPLGECDFGLTGWPVRTGDDGSVAFRLPASTVDELRELDRAFELPHGVGLDEDGHPLVPVDGMTA
jgi:L-lysine 2,3-aminomutase